MYGIELSRAVHNTVGVSAARRIQARKLLPGHLHGITAISLKSLHSLSLARSLSLSLSFSPQNAAVASTLNSIYRAQSKCIHHVRGDITLYSSRRWNWISWRRRNPSPTCKTSRYPQYSRSKNSTGHRVQRTSSHFCREFFDTNLKYVSSSRR